MADLDSQRLQQQVDELTNKLNGLSNSTGRQSGAFDRATARSNALGQAAAGAGTALSTLASQIYRGQLGAANFTKALKTTTAAAASASRGFEAAMGKRSGVSTALRGLGIGLTDLADIAAEMSDQLFNSFQSLTRVGAVGAQGMEGVFDQLQNFRLSLQDIGQLTALFADNAKSLALFGGTVTAGTKSLGQLRKIITTTGLEREFMALGMNTQEINEAMAGYVNTQVMTGRIQRMNTDQLVLGTEAYVKQMDELTKITGVSRKEAEAQIDANMRNERFAATVQRVRREQGDAAADNLVRNMAYLSAAYPETAEGLKDLAGGFVNTEAARKAELAGFRDVTQQLTGDLGPALDTLAQASQRNTRNFESLAQVSAFGPTFGAFGEQVKLAGLTAVDMAKAQEQARQEQNKQITETETGVKNQVELRQAQMDTMRNLQGFINLGVNPATIALNSLSKAAMEASSTLPGAKAIRGYGQQGAGTLGGSLAATGAAAAGGAAAGSPFGLPGIAIGGIVGGILGKLGYDTFGGGTQSIKPEDVINFGTGTGSRQHFDQLREDIRERAVAMAYAYFQETKGEKLNLNSAFRSAEEQAALIASGGQGANPAAAPGNSLHQQGRALDFNTSEVNALERMGLLKEFGFNRLEGDPPHIWMRDGGIASGPKSGYPATLHGTEAVVPLPDGKTIPVQMPDFSKALDRQLDNLSATLTDLPEFSTGLNRQLDKLSAILTDLPESGQGTDRQLGELNTQLSALPELSSGMDRQLGMLGAQLSALENIVSAMREQNSISTKILQAANN